MIKKVELLSPAGSYKGMLSAFQAGADAVYLGGQKFGARAYANNFSDSELLEAIDYAHLKNKKIYLTLNTLIKEKELTKELYSYIEPFYNQGLDAVIVQDTGIINYLKNYFPDLPIHASTQMTVCALEGVEFLKDIGIKRVVTARELSLTELKHIISNTDVEIEAFIHGAMCYSFSGQCLFSSILGGRSGNRGRCAQPCRLNYSTNDRNPLPYLSLRDMCTYNVLSELIVSGITSFKIEGRMKSPEYTGGVTSIYRYQIDLIEDAIKNKKSPFDIKPDKKEFEKLIKLYSRGVSGTGYYFVHNGPEMLTGKEPGYSKDQKVVLQNDNSLITSADKKLPVNCYAEFLIGRPAKITVNYKDIFCSVTGDIVEKAENAPLSNSDLFNKLNKTGNTDYEFKNIDLNSDDGIFYSIKGINELRRSVLTKLDNKILNSFRRNHTICEIDENFDFEKAAENNSVKSNNEIEYSALVNTKDQLNCVLSSDNIKTVYLERALWSEAYKINNKNIVLCLPHILRKNTLDVLNNDWANKLSTLFELCDGVLIRNLESYKFLKEHHYTGNIVLDSNLYTWNKSSLDFWNKLNIHTTTIPYELNHHEINERGTDNSEIVIYGYIPLMLSAQCIQKNLYGCAKNNSVISKHQKNIKKEFINNKMNCYRILKDRYNKEFPVFNRCSECYNIIYNSLPLDLNNDIIKIKSLGIYKLRYQFTLENEEETMNVLNKHPSKEFTRGHFNRGVE